MWFTLRKEGVGFLDRAPVVHVFDATVAAPRAAVFAILAAPQTWPTWFPGVHTACYASPPPYGVGTIRQAHVGRSHWVEEMIAWDLDERWAYTVIRSSVPFAVAQVESFDLRDAPTGTGVRWTLAYAPRLVARLGGPFAARVAGGLFRRAMANLEQYARDQARPDSGPPGTQAARGAV